MASCGYSQIVGGPCGSSPGNPAISQCVIIGECRKDIKGHLKSHGVLDSSLDSEARLLLARAGIFETSDAVLGVTICPRHRDTFGIRWRCNRRNCTCPSEWASHKAVKGDRGINLAQSERLFRLTQVLIPVASPICTNCRKKLNEKLLHEVMPAPPDDPFEDETKNTKQVSVQQEQSSIMSPDNIRKNDSEEVSDNADQLSKAMMNLTIEEEASMYVPEGSSSSSDSSDGLAGQASVQRTKMNEFLRSCNTDSIGPCLKRWEEASMRTKNSYVRKAKDAVVAALNAIAPQDAGHLWEALKASNSVEQALCIREEFSADRKYMEALAETYRNASSWDTRRQILSVMADLATLKTIQYYIPGLTEYRFKIARQHRLEYGRGAALPLNKSPRMRVTGTQLDHFLTFITSPHVIQDLPFGQRYLRLSSGKVLETPNVIRTMIPQRIVTQYQQYCKETEFKPFGPTTMLLILSACCATVRKSLQGLDYIAAEGAKAFDDLCHVVERLEEYGGLSRQIGINWEKSLKVGKQYLKSDYKVHVAESSSVADHCSTHSLNDSKELLFNSPCNHSHDKACTQCESLKVVLQSIESYLLDVNIIAEDELDDLRYTYYQAVQSIQSWKAHQLRSVRQDMARLNVLDGLDDTSTLITQDWAMKFLPQKYRESQSDWFGKRGISWHISVAARKKHGKLQSQAFVHIVKNCNQDSLVVVRILEHMLRTLKNEHPELSTAFLRQDNAGCYHSSVMLAACSQMAAKTGIGVGRVDFSDPQGGKGACDRKAATIKAHVRRYINEGHDVQTALDFKKAMLSAGGINGVRIALVDASTASQKDQPQVKLDGVSFLNNFKYSKDGITVWRAYNVGCGKLVRQAQIQVPDYMETFECLFSSGDFVDVDQKRQGTNTKHQEQDSGTEEGPTDGAVQDDLSLEGGSLFTCPSEGCVKAYQRHSALEKHLSFGKCQLIPERETLLDKAKAMYQEKLLEGTSAPATIEADTAPQNSSRTIPEGWALKSSKKVTRFNEAQKRYLEDKFLIGQGTGRKLDPATVARDMRYAKNREGARQFTVGEFLTAQQVQSFFSRKSSKLRQGQPEADLESLTEDMAAAEEQQAYDNARQLVLREVQLCHPIVFDTYDLCYMYKSNKLNQLSVAMLRTVCEHFDLNVGNITGRRKAPYLSLLKELIQACECCNVQR